MGKTKAQDDHEVAGCTAFSRTHSLLLRVPEHHLTIMNGGEHNGPLMTMHFDNDSKYVLQACHPSCHQTNTALKLKNSDK